MPARIEHALLDALLAPPPEELEACLNSGLPQSEGPFLHYRHELARAAVASAMPGPVSQALHRQLLAAMEASGVRFRLRVWRITPRWPPMRPRSAV